MSLLDKVVHGYENITAFQAAMLIAGIVLYVSYLFLRDMGVPPGPRGLPLFGYWPFLKPDTSHLQLQKLTKKYGDVFSFRVAGKLFIHLGSIKSIKEAHLTRSDYFAGRIDDYNIFSLVLRDNVALTNGERWKVLRKFFLFKFKEYGMNAVKENAASSVYDTLKETVEELHNIKGKPIQIIDMITMKCMTILRRIMFNDQGITMEELQELNDLNGEMAKGITSTNMMLVGKFARFCMFPFMPSVWKLKNSFKGIEKILSDVVNRHKSEYNESHVADLIDSFIKERDERQKKGDPTAHYFTDLTLVSSLSQFVLDGVLTTGVFIGNFLMTLVEHPEEQEKIYKEISEVIGTDRLPSLEDKTKMPYTNAFIYEVARFTDFFPLLPSLECSKETTVGGYKIPEGSITLLNLYCAHRNPKDFENPNEFHPPRYLSKPEKQRSELPVLFGVGKRSCMGEAFTMIQAYLFLTTIVQNFRLSFPEGSGGSSALFWSEEKLQICAYPRSQKSD